MSLTEEQKIYMTNLYQDSCRTPKIAAEMFEQKYGFAPHEATIRTRWKESGLELQTRGGSRATGSRKKYSSPLYRPAKNTALKT